MQQTLLQKAAYMRGWWCPRHRFKKSVDETRMLFIFDDNTLKVQRKPNALTPKPVFERSWWLDFLGIGKM